MSYLVRKQTVGKAQDLYNDLIANLANLSHYEDYREFSMDYELLGILGLWIKREIDNETEMAGEGGIGPFDE